MDEEEYQGDLIGFSVEGGPIVRFNQSAPDPLPETARLLGFCENNRATVVFQRDALNLMTQTPKAVAGVKGFRKGSS